MSRPGSLRSGSLHEPRLYEIRIAALLGEERARSFDGMAVTQLGDCETLIAGVLADQAALQGVLNRILDLGLPLLAVRQLATDGAELRP
jgi:hypothetical protein